MRQFFQVFKQQIRQARNITYKTILLTDGESSHDNVILSSPSSFAHSFHGMTSALHAI